MFRRVVVVHGSPRKEGNSQALAKIAIKTLADTGIVSDEIDASAIAFAYPGCNACNICQMSDGFGCLLDDELSMTVNRLLNYDAIILATPIFWLSYPAQIKILIDRMYGLIKFEKNEKIVSPLCGKSLALLATGSTEYDDNLDVLDKQCRLAAKMIRMSYFSCFFPFCNFMPGEAIRNSALVEQVKNFAMRLGTHLQCCS